QDRGPGCADNWCEFRAVWTGYDKDVIDGRVAERFQCMAQDRLAAKRQCQLWAPHAGTFAGGRHDSEDHKGKLPALMGFRGAGSATPRFRWAISSATMLIAISGTVCEPMSKPSGACIFSRAVAGVPLAIRSSNIIRIFRLLPIIPT